MVRRDLRPFIYAGLDLLTACCFALLFWKVIPTRHGGGQLLLWSLVAVVAVMGGAMLVHNRWGWRVAAAAAGLQLALAIWALALILSSASFLAGVYGAFGQAAAALSLVIAALVVQFVGLLPALQLKYLMTRAGRRVFGLEPLWR